MLAVNKFFQNSNLLIITGHYGVGKTNLCLNIAHSFRQQGSDLTLIDLDIVNPYFRSSDSLQFLDNIGVHFLGPVHAANATSLDTPSLPPGIDAAIRLSGSCDKFVLVDVGGDPDGARALRRYHDSIAGLPYTLLYVANFHRPEVFEPKLALENLHDIEDVCGIKVNAIFGNDHLKQHTNTECIVRGAYLSQELSEMAGIELLGISTPEGILDSVRGELEAAEAPLKLPCLFPTNAYVRTPWET